MNTRSFVLASVLLFSVVGWLSAQTTKHEPPPDNNTRILKTVLAGLNLEHPSIDLKTNIDNGDYRCIGINGYMCWPPGVQETEFHFIQKYGKRCLEGTSDVIENNEHMKLIRTARKYAENYNRLLLLEIKSTTVP